jgi:hypothetical protein
MVVGSNNLTAGSFNEKRVVVRREGRRMRGIYDVRLGGKGYEGRK